MASNFVRNMEHLAKNSILYLENIIQNRWNLPENFTVELFVLIFDHILEDCIYGNRIWNFIGIWGNFFSFFTYLLYSLVYTYLRQIFSGIIFSSFYLHLVDWKNYTFHKYFARTKKYRHFYIIYFFNIICYYNPINLIYFNP